MPLFFSLRFRFARNDKHNAKLMAPKPLRIDTLKIDTLKKDMLKKDMLKKDMLKTRASSSIVKLTVK